METKSIECALTSPHRLLVMICKRNINFVFHHRPNRPGWLIGPHALFRNVIGFLCGLYITQAKWLFKLTRGGERKKEREREKGREREGVGPLKWQKDILRWRLITRITHTGKELYVGYVGYGPAAFNQTSRYASNSFVSSIPSPILLGTPLHGSGIFLCLFSRDCFRSHVEPTVETIP